MSEALREASPDKQPTRIGGRLIPPVVHLALTAVAVLFGFGRGRRRLPSRPPPLAALLSATIRFASWTAYLLVSARVKNTFVR